ncbi:MAG: hypothetical protein KatS3mg027_0589 [Bacteroidia bacterium]|nr:MAG: hypothetical protein KatS3mg027_0589 [Bacteroidia bacterium]
MLEYFICRSKRWWQVVFVFLSGLFFELQAQFQAGLDAGHPFTILVNTDSIYYQNQTHGWFKFNTNNFSNITGNAVTLKGALLPTSSRIIQYDTVFVKSLIIYDSLMNIVFADTIKHIQDTLNINVTLNKNQNYWIDVIANYPCDTCVYNQEVTYSLGILGCPSCPPINLCFVCNVLSGVLTTSPPPNQRYCINSQVIINSNITFSSSEFKMGPNAKIIIGNGGMLTIDNCHIYTCGNWMWDGIKIYDPATNSASTGRLFIQNNSLIEDAKCAVSIPYGSPVVWTNLLGVTNTVFNKNDTAIAIRNFYPTTSPALIGISSTIFTCRKIPYSQNPPFVVPAAYYTAVRGSSSYPGSALTSPYINNSTYPVTTTKAGQNAKIGIYLNDVGTTSGTSLPLSYNVIQIGFGSSFIPVGTVKDINIFDNMQEAGIYAINANLKCVNNVFQNGAPKLSKKFGIIYGQGIYAEATTKNCVLRVRHVLPFFSPVNPYSYWGPGNNIFFDVSRAVNVKNYLDVEINNCDIRSTQTATGTLHKGEFGILDNTYQFFRHYVVFNTLFNIENGIAIWTDYGSVNIPSVGSFANAQYSGRMKVDSNIVQANYFSQTVTTQFVSNAIVVDNTAVTGVPLIAPYIISVKGNTLKDVYRGIYVNNYFKKNVYVYRNCITLRTESGNPLQYGIVKKMLTGTGFLTNFCTENDIKGPGPTNPNMYGIRIDQSLNEQVKCNRVDKVYNSIAFDGGSGVCRFTGNSMFNYMYGYSLKNNSIIGPQGAPGSPSDNQWGAANCFTQFKTLVMNANALSSPLYVRPNPPVFNPNGCGFAVGGMPYSVSNGLIYTTGGIALPCGIPTQFNTCDPYFPPTPITPSNEPTPPPFASTASVALIQTLEKIAQNQIPLPALDQWQQHNFLYRLLSSDTALRSTSPILNNYYLANQNSVHQNIMDIENDLFGGNLAGAQSKLMSWNPQNSKESTLKDYYTIRLNYALNNQQLTTNDSIQLYSIAASCEQTNGYAVSFARTFYDMLYERIHLWTDNCNTSSGQRKLQSDIYHPVSDANSNLKVIPNPARESSVQLWCEDCAEVTKIKVMDLSGKVLYEKTEEKVQFPYTLSIPYSSGVYLIQIMEGNGTIHTQKVILQNR